MTWLKFAVALLMTLVIGAPVCAMEDSSDDYKDEVVDESVIRLIFMGKTGSGKSTAVNACYNFARQKKWHENPKLFPIPTEFQECNVKRYCERAVENHRRGQLDAVTQKPSEYLVEGSGFKLGLIDCPGAGDSRGVGQDRNNAEATAEFLASVPYCNSFCVVLKSTVNRGTAEDVYCVEQIKSLLPLNARERIFIIVTHDTGARENIRTFVEEMGLPIVNIFYFDNFALTKAGHTELINIDLKADDAHDFVEDPFRYPEKSDKDAAAIATKIKGSWLASHREFNRMIRRANELGNFRLSDFTTIRWLTSDFTNEFMKGVELAESLEVWQAQLENALADVANAYIANTRSEEAYRLADEEYLLKENENNQFISCALAQARWNKWTPLLEQAERRLAQNIAFQEIMNRKLSKRRNAEYELDRKEEIVRKRKGQVLGLQTDLDISMNRLCNSLVRLDDIVMCASNSQISNYYDICIRREPNREKREQLNREKKLYLDLIAKYGERRI